MLHIYYHTLAAPGTEATRSAASVSALRLYLVGVRVRVRVTV